MTATNGDERPLTAGPGDEDAASTAGAGLDDDGEDGDDAEADAEDDALALHRIIGEDLRSLREWLDDWAALHQSGLDEALDAYEDALPDWLRGDRVEDIRGEMAAAVDALTELVGRLREAQQDALERLEWDRLTKAEPEADRPPGS